MDPNDPEKGFLQSKILLKVRPLPSSAFIFKIRLPRLSSIYLHPHTLRKRSLLSITLTGSSRARTFPTGKFGAAMLPGSIMHH